MDFIDFLNFIHNLHYRKEMHKKKKKKRKISLHTERYLCGVGEAQSLSLSRLSLDPLPSNPSIICPKPSNNISTRHKPQRFIDSKLEKEQLSTLSLFSIELFYVCVLFNA